MTLEEIRQLETLMKSDSLTETMRSVLVDALTLEDTKQHAFEDPFKFFYTDVVEAALKFDFRSALGDNLYDGACEDAKTCLNITLDIRSAPAEVTNVWLNAALKTLDNVVIHYIQEYLKAPFKIYENCGQETYRYRQLAHEPLPISEAGTKLENLYNQFRNSYEHRTKIDKKTNKLIIDRQNLALRKQRILQLLKASMLALLASYKLAYPESATP